MLGFDFSSNKSNQRLINEYWYLGKQRLYNLIDSLVQQTIAIFSRLYKTSMFFNFSLKF